MQTAVIIPAYRVEKHIERVINSIPDFIDYIIVIDDASPDRTAEIVKKLQESDQRIILIKHFNNQGVGGAMISGFRKALETQADICIKMDGDGQMDSSYLKNLLEPLIQGIADYTKGNRFRDFNALRKMPYLRRFGNLVLSFLIKAATGYWNIFDPTNGFIAIRREILSQLELEQIDKTYYFETSMLANLYLINAKVIDVPVPARYGEEVSNLKISKIIFEFPPKLLRTLIRRIILKYFLFDFSMASVYLMTGLPLLCFGLVFGILKWIKYASLAIPAPTGTVILPTMCILLGIQFILSSLQIDLNSVPNQPLSKPLPDIK
ncbi:glycosyltransferase family 2 protein [Bellilinea sp.]